HLAPLGRRPRLCPLPPLFALPTHFLLPLLRPYLPLPIHRQPLHALLPPLAPHIRPGAPLHSGDTALPQKPRRPRAARLQRCLVSFLRLVLSHSLFPALARWWGIRKAGKVARFGEQGYAVVYFLVVG
ncbi:hypothetical protein B0H13DRAFT_2025154, partial [Mycena leptocephala]